MNYQLKLKHLPIRMEMQKDIPELHAQPRMYLGNEHCNFC